MKHITRRELKKMFPQVPDAVWFWSDVKASSGGERYYITSKRIGKKWFKFIKKLKEQAGE